MLGLIVFVIAVGLGGDAPPPAPPRSATAASQAAPKPAPKPEVREAEVPRQDVPDLELLEKDSERGQFGELYITGRIRNNRARAYSYAQVQINLYNDAGEQVGSTLANTNNLEPGGVWRFKAVVFQDDATKYRVGDITGW